MPSQPTRPALAAARSGSPVPATRTGTSRRLLVRGSLAGAAAAVTGAPRTALAHGAARRAAGVTLRWFGANAWELSFDGRTVLIDPWLSRFSTTGPDGRFDPATPLFVDRAAIRRHLRAADLVLVTHGHYDHMGDVPQVLEQFPAARVVATQTHAHLLTAIGAPADRIIWARGGEYLAFGGYTVQVLPSLHSLTADYRYFAPGTLTAPPGRVRTVSDLVEGGTLAYQVTTADGLSVLNIGTANLIERELRGLRPDIAVIAVPYGGATHRYLERLLEALGAPRVVVPTHHDEMDTPLDRPVRADARVLRSFRDAVHRVSPRSTVVEPRYLEAIAL
ncbi:MBL fold metallo-hydrolase [Streptomyces sp. NPDC000410]|uniref:MBL fold metallo-hydrolase n=1 Tax=Streptomyces sp. NPDC000410 TaxID=3154254 RepID=UPI00331F93B6